MRILSDEEVRRLAKGKLSLAWTALQDRIVKARQEAEDPDEDRSSHAVPANVPPDAFRQPVLRHAVLRNVPNADEAPSSEKSDSLDSRVDQERLFGPELGEEVSDNECGNAATKTRSACCESSS